MACLYLGQAIAGFVFSTTSLASGHGMGTAPRCLRMCDPCRYSILTPCTTPQYPASFWCRSTFCGLI